MQRGRVGSQDRPQRKPAPAARPGAQPDRLRGSEAQLLRLQRQAGNAAVTDLLRVQRLWGRDGKVLRPWSVSGGEGARRNLKYNKGSAGVGKKKTFNTGFWAVKGDMQDQLHVHFGDSGGLSQNPGAHHFKRGATYGTSASNKDLERVFGSTNVEDWKDQSYTIPAGW